MAERGPISAIYLLAICCLMPLLLRLQRNELPINESPRGSGSILVNSNESPLDRRMSFEMRKWLAIEVSLELRAAFRRVDDPKCVAERHRFEVRYSHSPPIQPPSSSAPAHSALHRRARPQAFRR